MDAVRSRLAQITLARAGLVLSFAGGTIDAVGRKVEPLDYDAAAILRTIGLSCIVAGFCSLAVDFTLLKTQTYIDKERKFSQEIIKSPARIFGWTINAINVVQQLAENNPFQEGYFIRTAEILSKLIK